jgi:hypothetical protein
MPLVIVLLPVFKTWRPRKNTPPSPTTCTAALVSFVAPVVTLAALVRLFIFQVSDGGCQGSHHSAHVIHFLKKLGFLGLSGVLRFRSTIGCSFAKSARSTVWSCSDRTDGILRASANHVKKCCMVSSSSWASIFFVARGMSNVLDFW